MGRRKIVVLMLLVTALLLSLAQGVAAAVEENVWEYTGYFEDYITVTVTTPAQAYPGDRITIEVEVEAQEDLEDVYVDVRVIGTREEGTVSWKSSWKYVIDVSSLEDGDSESDDCKVDIPADVDPGLISGYISCGFYSTTDEKDYFFETGFPITYLFNKGYEDLLVDYDELEAKYTNLSSLYDKLETDYTDLKDDYTSLKADYDSLKATSDKLKSDYASLNSKYTTLTSDYDALKKNYDTLDSEHKSLQTDYKELESEHATTVDELGRYTTYTYVLAVATVIFVVTTIIFAVRKARTV